MKVTIRYMDNSISTLEVIGDELTLGTSDEYFTIEDENENELGWIVRENVKYVIMGELIDNFKDAKESDAEVDRAVNERREY